MNGAESLIHTALAAGVELCLANPGTTEMPLVMALDRVPGLRAVLGLFEGVCTGAADGYGRMAGKPALTLLHLGPGFANGIANLHNARRARSPVVNLIGDHATWHRAADAPLTADIVSLAKPVSHWLRTAKSSGTVAEDVAAAVAAAARAPGQVASLILPTDCLWGESPGPARPKRPVKAKAVATTVVEGAAARLRAKRPAALFLGGLALRQPGLRAAARVAKAVGCRIISECFPARLERGRGLPQVERLPYFPEKARQTLAGLSTLVLAGAPDPVTFFGYPDTPSYSAPPDCERFILAPPQEDAAAALEALAEALDAAGADVRDAPAPQRPQGALTLQSVGAALAAVQPEGAIIVDESNATGLGYFPVSAGAPPHSFLALTGGAIGQGPPCATGAALACPDRPVIDFQADGSAMYTLQALWTQAREGLHVVTLICANRSYQVLQVEMARAGAAELGRYARALTELKNPMLDFVQLSKGMGVPAARVDSAEALMRELERALAEPGPHLIEMAMQGQ